MTEVRVPDYPPLRIVIDIPLDQDNVPSIVDDGGVADWMIVAALTHLLLRMEDEAEAEEVELTPNTEDDED